MMDQSQQKQTGWAQRLQDWETTAPARPGEGPGPEFWDRLEPELPAPSRPGASRPFWLWGALVLLLLTHFTCFQPDIGYFPLAAMAVVAPGGAGLPDGEVAATAKEPIATARPEAQGQLSEGARREQRATGEGSRPTEEPADTDTEQERVATAMPEAQRQLPEGARREPSATGEESRPTGEPDDTDTEQERVATTMPEAQRQLPEGAWREPSATGEESRPTGEPDDTAVEPERVATARPQAQGQLSEGAWREPRAAGEESRPTGEPADTDTEQERVATAMPEAQRQLPEGARREPSATGVRETRRTKPQLWVAAHYAPVSNRTRLTLDPGVLTASRTRQTLAPELGLNLYLQFGEHWGVRTGYTSTQVETESQYRFIRFFNPLFESPNTAGDGVSKYNVDVASAYTKSSAEVELLRPSDRPLSNGARLRLNLGIRETIALQSIPLQLTYGHRWGRFELSAQLGPEWTNVRVLDFAARAQVQQPGLSTNRVRIQSRERISRSNYWSISGGLAATYQLGDRWRVGLTPEFTASLTNLSARPEFMSRSRSAGLRLELGYRLAEL